MKLTILNAIGAFGLLIPLAEANAQIRQPAPTGQIPKAYSGAQSNPAAGLQPKPTGQIAPEVPGQLGVIHQPTQTTTLPAQKVSEVQDLGFEINSKPASQQGMVPKVNTSQDPLTMPERYQPTMPRQTNAINAEQAQQAIEQLQQTQPVRDNATTNGVTSTQTTTQTTTSATSTAPQNGGRTLKSAAAPATSVPKANQSPSSTVPTSTQP